MIIREQPVCGEACAAVLGGELDWLDTVIELRLAALRAPSTARGDGLPARRPLRRTHLMPRSWIAWAWAGKAG
jgi:hypothetical protein